VHLPSLSLLRQTHITVPIHLFNVSPSAKLDNFLTEPIQLFFHIPQSSIPIFRMFKGTIFAIFSLALAFGAMAAPVAMPVAEPVAATIEARGGRGGGSIYGS